MTDFVTPGSGLRTRLGLDAIREQFELVKGLPKPKFDRIVVHDDAPLHWLKRQDAPPPSLVGLVPSLGIPVMWDSTVERGVIELRLGDEVYKRFYLPELRA